MQAVSYGCTQSLTAQTSPTSGSGLVHEDSGRKNRERELFESSTSLRKMATVAETCSATDRRGATGAVCPGPPNTALSNWPIPGV